MNIDDLDQCERCGAPASWHPRPLPEYAAKHPRLHFWRFMQWLLGFHPYQAAHVIRIPVEESRFNIVEWMVDT